MTRLRKSLGLMPDIALLAMLAQLWLSISCCTGQPAMGAAYLAFSSDTWCSASGTESPDQAAHKHNHACDCALACAAAVDTPVAVALPGLDRPVLMAERPRMNPVLVSLTERGPPRGRAPPAFL